jgi:hypothetical protein
MPKTATASTPSGGVHYYFNMVEGIRNRGALGEGVDLRGEGGFVLAPGSVMAAGKYQWLDLDAPGVPHIADAPQWLLDLVVRKTAPPAGATCVAPAFSQANSAYVEKAVQAELDETAAVPMGAGRNIRLNAAAFSLGTFVGADALPEHEARSMLQDVARGWGRDYKQCCKTIENGLKAGMLQPRDIPEPTHQDIPTDPHVVRRVIENAKAKAAEPSADDAANDNIPPPIENEAAPVDPWAEAKRPSLPLGLLPGVIEDYALVLGTFMGVDPGGVAAAALTVCAAAIPDEIKIKVKRHEDWFTAARLWVALVGNPSAKKSPIIAAVTKPLQSINDDLLDVYAAERAVYDALPKEKKPDARVPLKTRVCLNDVTIEAAQEVLQDSPDGVLLIDDELSGWFGGMEKYAGAKGGAKDRSFWLKSYDGGGHVVDRIGRGIVKIPNLSVSLLGGIQPEPIRKVSESATDDGLIQRLSPVVLGQAALGNDEAFPPVVARYRDLIFRLNKMRSPKIGLCETHLRFDDEAQIYRAELAGRHHNMLGAYESINKKLGSHVGKYDGIFARLCVIWQCIETGDARPDAVVSRDTAERVGRFLHEFLFPHAMAFYTNVLGLVDGHDAVLATAGFILAHNVEEINVRTVKHGDRIMRNLKDWQAEEVLGKLDALGWLTPLPLLGNRTKPRWAVRPIVHTLFAERSAAEAKRRADIRDLIAEAVA